MSSTWRILLDKNDATIVNEPKLQQSEGASQLKCVLQKRQKNFQKNDVVVFLPRIKGKVTSDRQIQNKHEKPQQVNSDRLIPSPSESHPVTFAETRPSPSITVSIPTTQYVYEAAPHITAINYGATYQIIDESSLPQGAYLIDDPQPETAHILEYQRGEERPYLNPRQFKYILMRRAKRQKLEAEGRIPTERQRYMHYSRHMVAVRRTRGENGMFEQRKSNSEEKKDREEPTNKEEPGQNNEKFKRMAKSEYMKMPMKIPEVNGKQPRTSTQQQQNETSTVKLNGIGAFGIKFTPLSKYKPNFV